MKSALSALVSYRIEQASDALKAATILLSQTLWRDSCNRSYYAMFYCVLALLALKGAETSKHSGAIAMFDKEFIKHGVFSKELSEILHRTFEMRLEVDYDEVTHIDSEDATLAVLQAKKVF